MNRKSVTREIVWFLILLILLLIAIALFYGGTMKLISDLSSKIWR